MEIDQEKVIIRERQSIFGTLPVVNTGWLVVLTSVIAQIVSVPAVAAIASGASAE